MAKQQTPKLEPRRRKVKILATIGPASRDPDMLRHLWRAGADAFRINLSHGDHQGHAETIAAIRALERELNRPIAILCDLQGPKLRIGQFERDPGAFFEWVKFRSHLSRGVTLGTMLQDEAFYFSRLGTFLERADNTARLVDVKFHAMGSEFFGAGTDENQEYDFYHWSAILRSVSAFEVYRKVYRDVIKPERVAELLVLRADMPRSLHHSLAEVVANLAKVANDQSAETQRRAGKLLAELQYGRVDEILATGLHAYLTQFLDRVNELGARISQDFLVPTH